MIHPGPTAQAVTGVILCFYHVMMYGSFRAARCSLIYKPRFISDCVRSTLYV